MKQKKLKILETDIVEVVVLLEVHIVRVMVHSLEVPVCVMEQMGIVGMVHTLKFLIYVLEEMCIVNNMVEVHLLEIAMTSRVVVMIRIHMKDVEENMIEK